MTGLRRPVVWTAAALVAGTAYAAGLPAGAAARERDSLRGIAGLVRVYDDILDARFDQADVDLQHACGPAPQEACDVLAATALWWRIQLDPASRSLDDALSAAVDHAIDTTEAWSDRDPDSAEASFYVGGAYAVRVQWRVLRGQKLGAARDGRRIRQALDRALELDPDLDDANFGIGLYEYYADVAPAAAKMLRFLLLLPGGSREDGLAHMRQARTEGRLLQGEADYQLALIDLWYEHRTGRAVERLESLHERYPDNPLFLVQLAQIRDTYLHDPTASLATWRRLLERARARHVNEALLAEVQARLGIARQLDALYETDLAIDQLNAVVALQPKRPHGALADAWMAMGEAQDRLGRHGLAIPAYRAAAAAAPDPDPKNVHDRATERQRRTPDPARSTAYRLSLEGWRLFQKDDLAGAEALIGRAIALDSRDPVAHYRLGRVFQGRRDDRDALVQFEIARRGASQCPAPIAAAVWLESGRVHEHLGQLDAAIAAYRTASGWFGADADTRSSAARALARLLRPQP